MLRRLNVNKLHEAVVGITLAIFACQSIAKLREAKTGEGGGEIWSLRPVPSTTPAYDRLVKILCFVIMYVW